MASASVDPVEVVQRYWTHLEAGEFEEAAAQFTDDVTYIHMPIFETRTIVNGRDELLHYFRDIRGKRDLDHILEKSVANEGECFVYGTGKGDAIDTEHVFGAYAELDDGKISHYSITNREKGEGDRRYG
ncbi:nuclear transport factor 2 family protein [Haloferax sp. MBLA0076]|uniref:Nuclear transport factor 2 family protein n=1 Tax=Haloferax litoreum TaxID=2666140 RepID=A0A6A8GMD2_9EURY|nr:MULTISPECIES: nuclear transport factor 2 family protein [Haloferax]KAB1190432.1 nuclear transport factor 2 family protein [Haloferax sp. CBA1148]MRX23407.1 nuclear transport factor 2 family protein [Haloferax litoreum]